MIDRFFGAQYRRWEWRYVDVALGGLFVLVLALTVVNVAGGVLYAHGNATQFARLLLVGELCMLVGAAVWVPFIRKRWEPLRRWAAGHRSSADADAAWRCLSVNLPRDVAIVPAIIAATAVPGELYAVSLFHFPTYTALGLFVVITMGCACGAVVAYLFAETIFAPVGREIAKLKPLAVDEESRAISLSTKLLVLPPVVTFYAAGLAAGLARDSFGPWGRAAVGLGAAITISLTISLVGTLLLRRSLLGPINALVGAAERVGAGDLDAKVTPLAADELGELTLSFNHMLEGLRERESLREHNVELDAALRQSLEEVRESRARIVAASDESRRRVERDLHDGAQQHLVLLQLKLGLVSQAVNGDAEAAAIVDEARADLVRALGELRELAHGIYPAVLENDGLADALAEAAQRAAVPTQVKCDGAGRYPSELEAAVYFCCLEALQNAAKHAGEGAAAIVMLRESGGGLVFEVADDGHGFEAAGTEGSAGLQNMADRIGALGGSLRIDAAPGQGTTVTGTVPLGG
jgi:signal transduction histidine kinase